MVKGDGILARGNGVVSTTKVSNGMYRVTFNQDITACAYLAQAGSTDAGAPPVGVTASTAQVNGNPDAVAVTSNNGGTVADASFDLAVFC